MKRKFVHILTILTVMLMIAPVAQASPPGDTRPNSVPTTQNPYSPAFGHPYRHGVVPTLEAHEAMQRYEQMQGATAASSVTSVGSGALSYNGGANGYGVTSGHPQVYIVVFGNQWGTAGTDANGNMTLSNDVNGAVPYLQQMFKGLGTGGELWSGVMTQFCDGPSVPSGAISCPRDANYIPYPANGVLAGVWYDDSAPSPASATQSELAAEAQKAAQHFGNTTAASNRYTQYFILSPSGTTPDGFNTSSGKFCAWHSATGFSDPAGGPYVRLAYTNMPYVTDMGGSCGQSFVNRGSAGLLDGFSIVGGHEYAETITDPIVGLGWINPNDGEENADECSWVRSGQGASANVSTSMGTFAMQGTWSNDTNQCELVHPVVTGVNKLSVHDDVYGYGRSFLIMDGPGALNIGGLTDTGTTISVAAGYYPVAIADLNGDGYDDIVWTSPKNDLYVWLGGISDFQPKYVGTYPAGWVVEGAGDVNNDGKADLLWLNPSSHQFGYWLMNGGTRIGAKIFGIAAGYYPAAIADLDGNGEVDVLWTSAKHDLYVWMGNGSGFDASFVSNYPAGWRIVGTADLVGEGGDSLIWATTDGSKWGYWQMNGATLVTAKAYSVPAALAGYSIVANGDYDGNGMADLIWSNGTTAVPWINTGNCQTSCNFSQAASLTLPSGEPIYNSSLPSAMQVNR